MHRNKRIGGPRLTLALYVVVSTVVAVAAGAMLGWLGSLASVETRAATGTVLTIVATALGVAGLRGRGLRPLQCDRETPQRWVHAGQLHWVFKNGAALGFGAGTRLGFVLWYAIPAGALLNGSAVAGAALYGLYGLARAGGAAAIWIAASRTGDFDPLLDWLGAHQHRARTITTAYLAVAGATTFVIVGL